MELFAEPTCSCLLHDMRLIDKAEKAIDGHSATEGKLILLLFVSNWCEPCHTFIRQLELIFRDLEQKYMNKIILVIIPLEDEENQAKELFNRTPKSSLFVPYTSNNTKVLMKKFGVRTVPKMIACRANGDIISSRGRTELESKGYHVLHHWIDSSAS